MDKLESLDYRSCEQAFKNEFDLNQSKHLKRMNLSIDLTTSQPEMNNLVPVGNFLNFNNNDEFKTLFKETTENPFARSFEQARLNPHIKRDLNFDDRNIDNNESLNTPSIDLKSFEPSRYVNKKENKLDLLISASNDQMLNELDNQLEAIPIIDQQVDDQQTNRLNKRNLINDVTNDTPSYKVFLCLPDGSSVSIEQNETTPTTPNIIQPNINLSSRISPPTSAKIIQPNVKAAVKATGRNNSRVKKKSQTIKIEKIETTTMKSIKTALTDSSSHLEADLIKSESFCSQSSQSSTTSSLFNMSLSQQNDLDQPANSSTSSSQSSSASSAKSKPGRRCKDQPKEDPSEKKVRSLERNRKAASRCRIKRKSWISALEMKEDELAKKNKELHLEYDRLLQKVQMMKSALLNNKTIETDTSSKEVTAKSSTATTVNNSTSESARSNLLDVLLQAAKNSQNNQDVN